MEFKYSICYPDRDEIDYFKKIVIGEDVIRLVKEFNWEQELKKELEHYSPSLDFIRLKDKKRIIFSGIGNGRLESFQVMYLIPETNDFDQVFEEKNYLGSESYTKKLSVDLGYKLLKNFVDLEDHKIIEHLEKDITVVSWQHDETYLFYRELTKLEHNSTKEEIIPEVNLEKGSKSRQFYSIIIGLIVVLLYMWLFFIFYEPNEPLDEGALFFGALAIFFFVGTIISGLRLRK